MRQVVLFIAVSADGYIAGRDGNVDWLESQEEPEGDSYSRFIENVDTVLMGWNTYHQVVTELSPGEWPYEGLKTWVFTHRRPEPKEGVAFMDEDPAALVRRLKEEPGKDIWVCGGAALARRLMEADVIDRFHLSVIPVFLGDGIRLFEDGRPRRRLRLLRTDIQGGIPELIYERAPG